MQARNMKLHPLIAPLFILIMNMTGMSNAHASRDAAPMPPPDFPYTSDEPKPREAHIPPPKGRHHPRFTPEAENDMGNPNSYVHPHKKNRNRMTAEERRDLRRQINEAGVNLYPHDFRH